MVRAHTPPRDARVGNTTFLKAVAAVTAAALAIPAVYLWLPRSMYLQHMQVGAFTHLMFSAVAAVLALLGVAIVVEPVQRVVAHVTEDPPGSHQSRWRVTLRTTLVSVVIGVVLALLSLIVTAGLEVAAFTPPPLMGVYN